MQWSEVISSIIIPVNTKSPDIQGLSGHLPKPSFLPEHVVTANVDTPGQGPTLMLLTGHGNVYYRYFVVTFLQNTHKR